ncbi:mandelate racemase/muconate lactonizing enzyme family protein [Jiangella aurantiaca]|uniref:Mandelate racemase/muconate lactonizing enzyme family protein n=1 Tax=Jiangella aurantiaca TaxID=2530373 RepID=A0A4R5ABT6_9ACTN|nr:mandelate racemase/muconate lactonizing enzyme family protein [Jiangella aurantiaca]TDD68459.1 mandelate racemase/muconate lactonizing enzyme family protein [Jiangella aurantiaca]
MTLISHIEAATAVVPLPRPVAFSGRTVSDRCYTLVRVTGDDGVSGIGFCYPGHRAGNLATSAVTDLLGPVLIGSDAHHVEDSWARMYQESLLHGRAGSVMRALSALDIALWDRNARAAGLPLHKYLGGRADQVPAYASGGYYLDGKGPDDLAEEMLGYVEAGFRAVKMKVGRLDPGEDAKRLAAVREAVGPDVLVMLDANNAFRDLAEAVRALRAWEPYDPYWIEEPFGPDDLSSHARLAQSTSVLVATGEIEAGRWRFKSAMDAAAAVILQTDAAVCGGITEFRKIATMADSYGITVSPHWFHDLHAPLVGALPNTRYVEYFPTADVANFRLIIDRQLPVDRGVLHLHDRPGLGFDYAEESLSGYLVEPWRRISTTV